MRELTPFLMFCREQAGKAEEAVTLYCSAFEDSKVVSLDRDEEGRARKILFEVGGNVIRAIDNDGPHEFTFTPALSLWVECSSTEELERAAAVLASSFLMPIGSYGFSDQFCWLADPYGVTWQLSFTA